MLHKDWKAGDRRIEIIIGDGSWRLDDYSKSKTIFSKNCYVSMLNFQKGNVIFIKSTPQWPISDLNKCINRCSESAKNVCGTLPAYIHKNSRQGEKRPAKGNVAGSKVLVPARKPMSLEDRMFLNNSIGGGQKSTVLLPRCRIKVDIQKPKRPHFFIWGSETTKTV
jgi:hypothetical protein